MKKAKIPTAYVGYIRADVWVHVCACMRHLDRLYQLTGSRVSRRDADDE